MDIRQDGAERPLPDLKGEALRWRAMTPRDLDGVTAVARLSFPDHPEDYACFANRLALNPDGCFVLAGEATDKARGEDAPVRGYLVAYPWRRNAAPPLNTLIEALPAGADVVYLHDLALHPAARGGGHTRPIIERLAEQSKAAGWPAIALVAVNEATAFWGRHGFEVQNPPGMAEKLASYGDDARYMIRTL